MRESTSSHGGKGNIKEPEMRGNKPSLIPHLRRFHPSGRCLLSKRFCPGNCFWPSISSFFVKRALSQTVYRTAVLTSSEICQSLFCAMCMSSVRPLFGNVPLLYREDEPHGSPFDCQGFERTSGAQFKPKRRILNQCIEGRWIQSEDSSSDVLSACWLNVE